MSSLLSSTIKSASINVVATVMFRVLTFALNAFILRRVDRIVLGVINVRLTLLDDTILFLSREAFRRSCLTKVKDPKNASQWKPVFNLIWCGVPNTIFWALSLGWIWKSYLSAPGSPELDQQYYAAVVCVCFSTLIQTCSEVFYIVAQIYLFVKLKPTLDFVWVFVKCLLLAVGVYHNPEKAILMAGYAHLIATFIYTLGHYFYFMYYCSRRPRNDEDFPFKSISDFLPTFFQFGIDKARLGLTLGFYKQGVLKMALTEGERYMMTFFDLLSFTEQGVYDVVANLGSLAARFIFRNVEDSAYFYFSQTVTRSDKADPKKDAKVAQHLTLLLRVMTLLGLIIVTFGFSYSHLLLHLYGGENLSSGIGPNLLRTHCVLVLFLALNGVSECYAFASMPTQQVEKFNYKMIWMSGIFLLLVAGFSKVFGPVGFIFGNIANFAMRLIHHLKLINDRHSEFKNNPTSGLFPSIEIMAILIISGLCVGLSESFIYGISPLYHVILGGCCFILTLVVIFIKESYIQDFLKMFFL